MQISPTTLSEIQSLRQLFLHENNIQFIYNKCHQYGWADTYLITENGKKVGYGSVYGQNRREDRDSIFEFYVIPHYRKWAERYFKALAKISNAPFMDCQSNDPLLTSMLYLFAKDIYAERILFEDHITTQWTVLEAIFRPARDENEFPGGRGDADFVFEKEGEIVATGGFYLNYNFPYADFYMETKESFRRQGLGCLMVQELKREIYQMGRVPAARCNLNNTASRLTMEKAGMRICGYMLIGKISLT
ncbi:MAG: N-acetyltransferase [Bacteroidetes bacterium]|nr:N-acetyltransferase [Bacteroidota bacterium]